MSGIYRLSVAMGLMLLAGMAIACGTDKVDLDQVDVLATAQKIVVDTVLDADAVAAGDSARGRCVVTDAMGHAIETSVVVEITPEVPVAVDGMAFHLVPTVAIEHQIACRVAIEAGAGAGDADADASAGVDSSPATLRVHAAALAIVDTALTQAVVEAGAWAEVACTGGDAFGNATDAAGAVLNAPAEAQVDGLRLRLTRAAEFAVACGIAGVVDDTPAALTVRPAPAAAVDTSAHPQRARAREVVQVRCRAVDAFGNAVDVAASSFSFSVLDDDNRSALLTGLVVQPDATFSVTRAGRYRVFCGIPGHPEAADESPAAVDVVAGLPYQWFVSLTPMDCYHQGQALPLTYAVYDDWGNQVENVATHLQATSGGSVSTDAAGAWVLDDEAQYDLTLTLLGEQHPDSRIVPFVASLRVDSTPPVFTLTHPTAAMFVASDPDSGPVEITGWAQDGLSGVTQLSVAGRTIHASGDASGEHAQLPFAVEQSSHWGLNLFGGWAQDGCGNRTVLARSYLRSADFAPAQATPAADNMVHDALVVQLGQEFLNDRDRRDVDDLATALTLVLERVEVGSLLPTELGAFPDEDSDGAIDTVTYAPCDTVVGGTRTNLKTGLAATLTGPVAVLQPAVTALDPLAGAIRLGVSAKQIAIPLEVRVVLDAQCFGNTQATVAAVAILDDVDIAADLALAVVDGRLHVAPECVDCLRLSLMMNPSIDFDYGSLEGSGLAELVDLDAMGNALIDLVEGRLIDLAREQINERLASQLDRVDAELTIHQGFDLPAPLQGSMQVSAGIDGLTLQGPEGLGQMVVSASARVAPNERGKNIPAGSLGAIRLGGAPAPTGLRVGEAFAVSVKTDLINQVLWAIWYGGGFDIPDAIGMARALFPNAGAEALPDLRVSMFAGLPPVAMPSEIPGEIRFGLGNLYVEADLDPLALLAAAQGQPAPAATPGPMHIAVIASALVSGGVVFDDSTQQFGVVAKSSPRIILEVVAMEDPSLAATMSDAMTRLLSTLLPSMLGDTFGSFPMPSVQVAGVQAVVAGTWRLRDASVMQTADGGYLRVGGAIEHLPPADE